MNRTRFYSVVSIVLLAGSLNSGLAETPADLKPLLNQVYKLAGRRDYEAALPIVEQAVAKYPQNYDARTARGRIYMGLEEDKKAVADFQWALSKKPKDYQVTADLANAYSFLSDQKSALKYVDMTLANCPQTSGYFGVYYRLKSDILNRVERYDEAEQALTKALQNVSSDPHWYFDRLKCRMKISRWQGAIEDANRCLPMMPKFNEQILQMRAKAYVGLKRYPEAIRDLDQAIKQTPLSVPLHQDKQDVYQLMGKKDLAEREHKSIEKLLEEL